MYLNSRYVCKSVSCNVNVWPGVFPIDNPKFDQIRKFICF